MNTEYKGALAILDVDTGEVIVEIHCLDIDQLKIALSQTAVLIDKAVKAGSDKVRNREFVMSYQSKTKQLVIDEDFSGSDAKVLLYIQSTLGYGNRIRDTQTDIAKILGLGRSTVAATFAKFKKSGVVYRDDRIKNRVVFKLDSSYAIKGKPKLKGTARLKAHAKETKTGNTLVLLKGGAA